MVKSLEETIKFVLIGAFDQIDHKENNMMERQDSITGKIFGGLFA